MYRQGDVLLVPVKSVGKVGTAFHPLDTKIVQRGETTGHAHRIEGPGVALLGYTDEQPEFVKVDPGGQAFLRHEEHAEIELPEGTYRIIRQREWSPEGERRVRD